ncbi:MAG TPA: methyltransferase domain-containing protein, partial [Micropruina sp.]|nr:methyltransferase domain-containing protein [Micropruina sp.]
MTETEWNEHYAPEVVWSGDPNGALVAEVIGLAPGRAVDVGCGEGADAVWLASQGWQVTAFDVAGSALERGRAAADAA